MTTRSVLACDDCGREHSARVDGDRCETILGIETDGFHLPQRWYRCDGTVRVVEEGRAHEGSPKKGGVTEPRFPPLPSCPSCGSRNETYLRRGALSGDFGCYECGCVWATTERGVGFCAPDFRAPQVEELVYHDEVGPELTPEQIEYLHDAAERRRDEHVRAVRTAGVVRLVYDDVIDPGPRVREARRRFSKAVVDPILRDALEEVLGPDAEIIDVDVDPNSPSN